MARMLLASVALVSGCLVAEAQHGGSAVTAAPRATFHYADSRQPAPAIAPAREGPGVSPPLEMPTAVSVSATGRVYVADGVNDRVLQFDRAGQFQAEITHVGDAALSRPIGLYADDRDRLWIADTGNARVLVRAPDGTLERVLVPPRKTQGHAADLTGVAVSADGVFAWLVDNDGHEVLRIGVEDNAVVRFGGYGQAMTQLAYPFQLAVSAGGDVAVSDVINGRVLLLDQDARPVRQVSSYGVFPGQLYRPKGVAFDAQGNLWVSDGVLGVVQAFAPEGTFLGVLRDADGQILRFEDPSGLAFDTEGLLYVVELGADRVRSLAVRVDRAAAVASTASPPAPAMQQPRACTACHLEWMNPLASGVGTELIAAQAEVAEHPLVSRAQRCLSCHDGTVVDSRRRVWVEHGHQADVVPPPEMQISPRLPRVEGKIVCRTCHSAHTRGGSGNVLKDAVFLRIEHDPTELCFSCHGDYGGGTAKGMHPVTDDAVASALPGRRKESDAARPAEAAGEQGSSGSGLSGGAAGRDPAEPPRTRTASPRTSCLACHVGHGAGADALLVKSPQSNALCLDCHMSLGPELFGEDVRSAHGREPRLTEAQAAVAAQLGTRLGPDQRLLCLSCHRVHRAPVDRHLLAFDPARYDVCSECHQPQRDLLGSRHDLRESRPDAVNRFGQTAVASGPCGACHNAHQFAQPARPGALDPAGKCLTCHDSGQTAGERGIGTLNHPAASCGSCHDAHAGSHRNFVALPNPADLCTACHADQARLAAGPHDLRTSMSVNGRAAPMLDETWPPASRETRDACLSCHRPHGHAHTGLWRVPPVAAAGPRDGVCLGCHAEAAPGTASAKSLMHPRLTRTMDLPTTMPFDLVDGTSRILCVSCHSPHRGGPRSVSLLRTAAEAPAQEDAQSVCISCHKETAHIAATGHGPATLHTAGFNPAACGPCHAVHGRPEEIEQRFLFPRKLHPDRETVSLSTVADSYCIGCHREGGPVPPPGVATHPRADMYNPQSPDHIGYLPLFNEQGEVDPAGGHACRTCHLTHGRQSPAPVPLDTSGMPLRELRARQWHLRLFTGENVCTTCHGFDALRRFIYFHTPALRTGPIAESPPPPTLPR